MADYSDPRPSSQPEGSTDLEVAKDNLITLDKLAVSTEPVTNRKGEPLTSFKDIGDLVDEAITEAIDSIEEDAKSVIVGLGYIPPIVYTGGISFTTLESKKTIDRDGIIYAPLIADLPFTTSGTWVGDDDAKFFAIWNRDRLVFETTSSFILAGVVGASIPAGVVIETNGYSSAGDGGGATWTSTGNTDTPSQNPVELDRASITDGNGNEYNLIPLYGTAQPEVNAAQLGAIGGATDNQPALQVGINEAYLKQFNLHQIGYAEIDNPLSFQAPASVNYWDDTSNLRPPQIFLDSIKCNSVDQAFDVRGEVIGADITINNLIGPGVTSIEAEGSGIERIGVRLSHHANTVKINSISDFNINVCFDGAFNNRVSIGSCFASIYAVHSRIGTVNTFTNQNNRIEYGFIGGVFTGEAFGDDALRRSRGCKHGIYMKQGSAFKFVGGALKYIQRDSDSVFIKLEKGAHNNKFFSYMEGARDDGYYLDCDGDDNEFFLSEMRGTSTIKGGAFITGIGNTLKKLPGRVGDETKTERTAEATAGVFSAAVGNIVEGKNSIIKSQVASVLQHDIISGVSRGSAGNGSVLDVADFPQESDGNDSIRVTVNDDSTFWVDFANISLAGEDLRALQIHSWIKGVTNHAKVAFYIVDNDDKSIVLSDPISTGLSPTTQWQKISSMTRIDTPPSGSIALRIAIRNTVDSETGCVCKIYPPVVTFNIGTTNRSLGSDVLPNADTVKGKVIPEEVLNLRTQSFKVHTLTDLPLNNLTTNGRGIVNISDVTGGGNVAAISNMRENTSITLVNSSSSAVTILSSAGEWATNFSLLTGETVTIVDVGGLKYINRS